MSKMNAIKNYVVIALGMLIIVMSVGLSTYAVPQENSEIKIIESEPKWEVRFENLKTLNTTNIASTQLTEPTLNNTTDIDFAVKVEPSTLYEFNIDVVNMGSIDARLANYKFLGIEEENEISSDSSNINYLDKNLKYKVTYMNGEELTEGDILRAGERVTLRVMVSYLFDSSYEEIDSDFEKLYVFDLDLNYVQAD